MGLPVVGRRHRRKARTPQAPDRGCGDIPERICCTCGSGRSSINHQQSLQSQEPATNHNQHGLGTLSPRGIACQSAVHPDSYIMYAKNWIIPRWGKVQLQQVKTVEVERWLRATDVANGTKAKIKCVMSALFSHAVRWEFCNHNPISSGIQVGSGGKRGPSTGVRVSAKRQKSPLKLTAEQVALVLTELEFRDQLLVFLDAGLGTRRGELGALRWMDCDFINQVFDIQHSYYWRRGGHLIDTKSEASAQPLPMHPTLRDGLLDWRSQCFYNQPGDYVFASERLKGRKPLDLASVLKKKIQPAFKRIGITGVGWHTFRHTVGTMLAEMGQHQLTIRDYLRHSNLHVTNKYLQATSNAKRVAQDKLVDAILPTGLLPAPKLIQ